MGNDITSTNRFKFFIEAYSFANQPFELAVMGANVPGVNLGIIEQPTRQHKYSGANRSERP